MAIREEQVSRLEQILPWARLAGVLTSSLRPHEQGLHLRPSGTGIRVVHLDPTRPQLDRGKITREADAVERMQQLMAARPGGAPGRSTPEKRLQSWLISQAYGHGGAMVGLSEQLRFVTDEQVFPSATGKIVCDLLALRAVQDGAVPVVVELKSRREMARLVEQLNVMAEIVDAHLAGFQQLFSAVLGRDVRLVGPCERWLVWPATQHGTDPRAAELARQRIVVKGYRVLGESFSVE